MGIRSIFTAVTSLSPLLIRSAAVSAANCGRDARAPSGAVELWDWRAACSISRTSGHLAARRPGGAIMSTAVPQPQPHAQTPHQQAVHYGQENLAELRIYSHSNLLYWWPVW